MNVAAASSCSEAPQLSQPAGEFPVAHWDSGRLQIVSKWSGLFRAHGLDQFDQIWDHTEQAGGLARNHNQRETSRFELTDEHGTTHAFYIKRQRASTWKEWWKNRLRFAPTDRGARDEWEALIGLQALGIPTARPVALGEADGRSFVIMESLEDCIESSDLPHSTRDMCRPNSAPRRLLAEIARIARVMHGAGWHHQDFYLCHFLRPRKSEATGDPRVYLLDLHRARQHRRLPLRWQVKDLAQLNYSAQHIRGLDRLRWFRAYLGRPFQPADRFLLRLIAAKTALIARHDQKRRPG